MGEFAALGASFLWAFTSIQFTVAGRQIGSDAVNRTRLAMAVVLLSLTHLVTQGELWPMHVEPFRWGWLGLSAIIGLVLGDGSLFQAFVLIGPRRSMLVMTSVPVISVLLAWLALGETLQWVEILAILLTVAGIAWVVSERRSTQATGQRDSRRYALGVLLALGGALGQSLGLVASKQGLVGDFSSLSASLIRMVVATIAIWLIALVRRRVGATWQALTDRKIGLLLLGGALTGPFLGVWASMVAVQRAPVGIASTLMGLSPILLIPLERWVFHERVSTRSVVGTVIALAGASIILLT
jgi:drug/metabolite transporter (DMT)-like permease